MIKSQKAKKVLCYGDSNTWGQKPFKFEKYEEGISWIDIVNEGQFDYQLINYGLCGRTAGDIDVYKPFHNGLEHFLACAYQALPFDVIIIALGTNDLQSRFEQTPAQILNSLLKYLDHIEQIITRGKSEEIKVYLLTPPLVDRDTKKGEFFENADIKLLDLVHILKVESEVYDYKIINCSDIVVSGEDGVHFSENDHKLVADIVINALQE